MGLKVIAFLLIAIGAFLNYGSKLFVKRFRLYENVTVEEAHELSQKELEVYKMAKAMIKVKILGFFVLLAGVIMVYFAYR
jgi:hypothetical protein